jgi:hypothetical protein
VVALLAVLLPAPGARAAILYTEMHSVFNGKCVNVAGNSTAAGVKIQQYHCDNTSADNFFFTAVVFTSTGTVLYYEIQGQNSGLCITPDPSQTVHDGTPLVQEPCTGAATQLWVLGQNYGRTYEFFNAVGSLCITDPGYSSDDWTQLQIQPCNGNPNAEWTLVTS